MSSEYSRRRRTLLAATGAVAATTLLNFGTEISARVCQSGPGQPAFPATAVEGLAIHGSGCSHQSVAGGPSQGAHPADRRTHGQG